MKLTSSIKKLCKNCILIRRNQKNYIKCSNLKHKRRQG